MKHQPILLLYAILFLLNSCQHNHEMSSSVEGVWKSIGYGEILHIEDNGYAIYDVTNISCLPKQQGELASFDKMIKVQNDTLILYNGTGIYHYTKMDVLPSLCTEQLSESKKKDILYNFEVLAQTIQHHFAYFDMNNINWDSLYQYSKAKITPNTNEAELYLILEEVINTLKDNHGYIEPTDEVYEQVEALQSTQTDTQITEELREYGDFEIAKIVAQSFLEEDMTKDTWLMHWGKMKNNVGYIQVKCMWLYADLKLSDSLVKQNGFVDTYVESFTQMNEGKYIEKERKGVAKLMNIIMNDLKETEYIILDVRFNGGGQDAVSLEILSRFNEQRRQVAHKKAITQRGFTKEIPIFMEASPTPYLKPVYLLTSQQSASATDFMSLASQQIHTLKRIGSHTEGALSDALEKQLPNGWFFATSNEIYTDMKGICYESVGIPVDYELNYPEDRQTFFRSVANDLKRDQAAILKAIGALK